MLPCGHPKLRSKQLQPQTLQGSTKELVAAVCHLFTEQNMNYNPINHHCRTESVGLALLTSS